MFNEDLWHILNRNKFSIFAEIETGAFQTNSKRGKAFPFGIQAKKPQNKFAFVLLHSDETPPLALLLGNTYLIVFQNLFGLSLCSINKDWW